MGTVCGISAMYMIYVGLMWHTYIMLDDSHVYVIGGTGGVCR